MSLTGGAAFAEQTLALNCNGWQVNGINVVGTITKYKIGATCSANEKIDNVEFYLMYTGIAPRVDGTVISGLQGASMSIEASYDSASGAATETATLNRASFYTNGSGNGVSTTFPGAGLAVRNTAANCKRDPFFIGVTPSCTAVTHGSVVWPYQSSVWFGGDSNFSVVKAQFNGGSFPQFIGSGTVDPNAVKKQELQNQEDKTQTVVLTAPKANTHFYSQDVQVQALIPSKYKKDGQLCCTVELQKSNGQNGWLPTLPLGNKPNIDLNGYTLPFADFQSVGYGLWRIRVAPSKYNPNDYQAWSDWVVFEVMPKEILEVPNLLQPTASQVYKMALPIQVKIPDVAKKAGVKCCDIEYQVAKTPANWGPSKIISEPRLANDDNAVQYDAYTLVPGGGDVRLRVRFAKADGEALGWSAWRMFTVPPTNPAPTTAPVIKPMAPVTPAVKK